MTQAVVFSTSQVPEHERVAAWKKLILHNTFDGDFEPLGPAPFEGSLTVRQIGPALCSDATSGPAFLHHRQAHVEAPQQQRFIIQAILEGSATYFDEARGPTPVKAGDLIFGESRFACGFVAEERARVASFLLPRAAIIPTFATTGAILARWSQRSFTDLPSRLLFDLVTELSQGSGAPALRASGLVSAVGGLVALALDGISAERLHGEGVGSARLAAILDYLRARHGDAMLDAATVAATFQISVRYLNKLMERTGRSFRQELTAIRLGAAMRALRDPAQSRRSISSIAYDSGFGDLSQFNRRFRARYDMTPRQARRYMH